MFLRCSLRLQSSRDTRVQLLAKMWGPSCKSSVTWAAPILLLKSKQWSFLGSSEFQQSSEIIVRGTEVLCLDPTFSTFSDICLAWGSFERSYFAWWGAAPQLPKHVLENNFPSGSSVLCEYKSFPRRDVAEGTIIFVPGNRETANETAV